MANKRASNFMETDPYNGEVEDYASFLKSSASARVAIKTAYQGDGKMSYEQMGGLMNLLARSQNWTAEQERYYKQQVFDAQDAEGKVDVMTLMSSFFPELGAFEKSADKW